MTSGGQHPGGTPSGKTDPSGGACTEIVGQDYRSATFSAANRAGYQATPQRSDHDAVSRLAPDENTDQTEPRTAASSGYKHKPPVWLSSPPGYQPAGFDDGLPQDRSRSIRAERTAAARPSRDRHRPGPERVVAMSGPQVTVAAKCPRRFPRWRLLTRRRTLSRCATISRLGNSRKCAKTISTPILVPRLERATGLCQPQSGGQTYKGGHRGYGDYA